MNTPRQKIEMINVTTAGAFVSLPDSGATGLWRGANATIGQKLKVKLTGVDEALGRIELEPVKDSLPNQIRVTPWQKKNKPAKPSPWQNKNKRRRR